MILTKPRKSLLINAFGVAAERHLGDADLAADGERVGLGEADVGDLRLGEDRAGRLVVVEMAVGHLLQAHHVLGDLATLHRGDTAERKLAADVARRVDVRHVALAVAVDRDEPTGVDLDTGRIEPEAVAVGNRPDRQHGVRAVHDPAVVATHDDRVAAAFDRRSPARPSTGARRACRKSASSTAATSGSFCGSTCWRLTTSVTLAPKLLNMCTNSTPVTPEPITVMLSGKIDGG